MTEINKRFIIITKCSECHFFNADESVCKRTHFQDGGDSWYWKEITDPETIPEWCPLDHELKIETCDNCENQGIDGNIIPEYSCCIDGDSAKSHRDCRHNPSQWKQRINERKHC